MNLLNYTYNNVTPCLKIYDNTSSFGSISGRDESYTFNFVNQCENKFDMGEYFRYCKIAFPKGGILYKFTRERKLPGMVKTPEDKALCHLFYCVEIK